jgi:aubergine-like protein
VLNAGHNDASHVEEIERYFSNRDNVAENVFVLDFVKPRGAALDTAYPFIKCSLGKGGFLSQFVNFGKCDHGSNNDKKSSGILQGVSRQMLQKCGARLWWTHIPSSVPLPLMVVGVDVSHAPPVYGTSRKPSCAAIVIEVIRGTDKTKMELYSRAFKRNAGEEFNLADALNETISAAVRLLKVDPKSVVVWRDGISNSAFDSQALEEIGGIRRGLEAVSLKDKVPISYVVCQKQIPTKLLVEQGNNTYGAPAGTLVSGVTDLDHETFYINGTSPPFSTPKPARFTVIVKDKPLENLDLATLSAAQCYDFPNWPGPIKVPATVQMAHKLAELGGQFPDFGESVDNAGYVNRPYFL